MEVLIPLSPRNAALAARYISAGEGIPRAMHDGMARMSHPDYLESLSLRIIRAAVTDSY
jgi:hypothetical protein